MKRIYIRPVGNSFGVLLPKPLLAHAGFGLDMPLHVLATAGEIRIVPAEGTAVVLTPDEIGALMCGDLESTAGVSAVAKLKASMPL